MAAALVTAESAAAMATGTDWLGLTCPVCHEDFSHPKILPCTHLVCRDCVLTLLKGDHRASCPLCLTPIFLPDTKGQRDLDLFVDDLATDLVTKAKVEVHSALRGDDTCVCAGRAVATAFCGQCVIKLCAACAQAHTRLPATQTHHLHDLHTLNPDELLRNRHSSPCSTHPHQPTDLFCRRHRKLICIMCASALHGECPDVVSVPDGARYARARLKDQIQRLKKKARKLDERIQTQAQTELATEASLRTTRQQITTLFHKLHQTLEVRQQQLLDQLDLCETRHKNQTSSTKTRLEKHQQMLVTFTDLAERFVDVDDEFLLAMSAQLQSKLDEVEGQQVPDAGQEDAAIIVLDTDSFEELVEKISTFGAVNTRRRSSGSSNWVFVEKDDCTPRDQHPSDHGASLTRPKRTPMVRQRSNPCSQCADDIVALDNGDMYTCHGCTRVWFACDACGCVVTLRHGDGFRSEVSECPQCGDC